MIEHLQEENIKIWNNIYKDYEKGGSMGNEYPNEYLVRFVSNLRKNESFEGKALEIGFGLTANLRMLRDKGFKAYGLEVSEEAVVHGRLELEKRGIDDIKLDVWKPVELPFEDGSFNLVCGIGCIYYILNLEEFIRELYRILVSDGVFMFSFLSSNSGYMNYIEWTDEGYARWSDNHPNLQIRGCSLRQPKSKDELLKLFDMFDSLRVFTWETDQLPMFHSFWNITGEKASRKDYYNGDQK